MARRFLISSIPFVKCVEPCVKASVVKVEYMSHDQESENPEVSFDVAQHLLNHVTDGDACEIRIPHPKQIAP